MSNLIDRIIVPMDGSEASMRAWRLAKTLARAGGLDLHLLHVHPVEPGAATGMAQLSKDAFERASSDAGNRAFGDAGAEVDAAHRHVRWGEPVEEILIFAEAQGPALLVMGRGSNRDLAHYLVGSVSDGVLRRSAMPVTLVH